MSERHRRARTPRRSGTIALVSGGPILLVTNCDWYERLSREATGSPPVRLDEACFWHPNALRPYPVHESRGRVVIVARDARGHGRPGDVVEAG